MQQSALLEKKIIQSEELLRQLAIWKFKEQKIVFTNGCFDILHLGHIDYLCKAADAGDVLIIGLNSDESVSRLKGPCRPVNNQHARAMVLASLSFVDAIVIFNEDTPYNLIEKIQPDILIKGKDYRMEDIAGYDIVLAKGGEVITVDLLPDYSTTGLVQRLLNLNCTDG